MLHHVLIYVGSDTDILHLDCLTRTGLVFMVEKYLADALKNKHMNIAQMSNKHGVTGFTLSCHWKPRMMKSYGADPKVGSLRACPSGANIQRRNQHPKAED